MLTTVIFDFENSILERENVEIKSILPILEKYGLGEEIMDIFIRYMKGDIEREEFLSLLGHEELERAFLDSIKIKDETKKKLQELSKKYTLALFSNLPTEWFWYIVKKNDIEKFFQYIILSRPIGIKRYSKDVTKIIRTGVGEHYEDSMFVSSDEKMKEFLDIQFVPYKEFGW